MGIYGLVPNWLQWPDQTWLAGHFPIDFDDFPTQTSMTSGIFPPWIPWILHDSTIKIHQAPSSGRSPDSWYEGRWHWPKCSSSSPGRWPGSDWEMIWEKGSNLDDSTGWRWLFLGEGAGVETRKVGQIIPAFWISCWCLFMTYFRQPMPRSFNLWCDKRHFYGSWADADEWSRQHP